MPGLFWKLALAGTAFAAIRAYRRQTHSGSSEAGSLTPGAVSDDVRATPPHGDTLQATERASTTAAADDPDGAVPA
ncbi:hypothetical protein ACP93_20615 [Xanthomonas sp. NCPPB 1128]|uniref:hypothetical protein n=1 Tax=Xanthomonas sp. NCPPB 1128 TaxID=1775876 RepID=UPI00065AFC70|nr:hypothetical protein [Xanthomonas sp. NCPPB 1128]KMM73640.1 hypothetical protein ACP93_20615 [Xanthomonas sp. NCPPB 1128]